MTKEDKELLLIDLCARWPYNNLVVRVTDMNDPSYQEEGKLRDIKYIDADCNGIPFLFDVENVFILCDITEIKPYLRPMSSMTEEEFNKLKEYSGLIYDQLDLASYQDGAYKCLDFYLNEIPADVVILVFDWLNKKGFDYRGLIPKNLALSAHVGMYKF